MGEEINNLKRRGGLLEDGALLVPIMRKRPGVPKGSVYQCTAMASAVLQAGSG